MLFKKLSDNKEVNLVEYALDFMSKNPHHKIYIGTDSQNINTKTVYATVIVFHNNAGGHVLFSKLILPRIVDRFTRLWKEVEMSVEAAEQLKNSDLPEIEYIDLDFNPDPKYKSNQVLRAALGYVESLGYRARIKPYATMASCMADRII